MAAARGRDDRIVRCNTAVMRWPPANSACPVERLDRTTVRTNSCTPNKSSPSSPKTNRCLTLASNARTIAAWPTTTQPPPTRDPRVHRAQTASRGYPPSVREIGEAVGLTSPSTVHSHLNTLQRLGYLRRDPDKAAGDRGPLGPNSGVAMERRPVRHVPLVGDVAAGTDVLAQENVEELLPVPARLHRRRRAVHAPRPRRLDDRSRHPRRRLRGRRAAGDRQERRHRRRRHPGRRGDRQDLPARRRADHAGPGELDDAADELPAGDVTIYGRVVTVMRRL